MRVWRGELEYNVGMGIETDIENARLVWQEDGAPFSAEYEDVYFSREGGLAETHYVFLEANDLVARWRALDAELVAADSYGVFTIAELGFGTGLNFLCCWRLWQQVACRRLRLQFISCEKHPLTTDALQQALRQWPQLDDLAGVLLSQYPEHSAGIHRLLLGSRVDDGFGGSARPEVLLDLYYGDGLELLQQQSSADARVDAWFLDGFTPARNPALWSDEILQTIAGLSRAGTTLSSYSVTGRVVRKLRELGFAVEKRKGFGSKRQMLFGQVPGSAPLPSVSKTAVVIGAGLAGATAARALANRGVRVTVVESRGDVAQGASGNPQAVVQLRLNKQPDIYWQFHTHSYLYALRFYAYLSTLDNNKISWHNCGVLTLDSAYTNTRDSSAENSYSHYPEQLLRRADADETEALCGVPLSEGGYMQALGGWLNPAQSCEVCLNHPLISVITNTTVNELQREAIQWVLKDQNGALVTAADIVVIANSYHAREFEQTRLYPVAPLRGQITQLAASDQSTALHMVVCSERYLAPASSTGEHCIGASYVKQSTETQLSRIEQDENLARSSQIRQRLQLGEPDQLRGRASIRGSSGDYLPIAGAVPDPELPELTYGSSRHLVQGEASLEDPAALPGLLISTGHGSHGTVSCPILAEHIACIALGEASPLPRSLAECVAPIRFIRRQRRKLARGQNQPPGKQLQD